jgi:hypothetical protein
LAVEQVRMLRCRQPINIAAFLAAEQAAEKNN